MYGYEIWLGNKLVTASNYEYDSAYEAESEGNFAVSSYADVSGVHWSKFTVVVCGD